MTTFLKTKNRAYSTLAGAINDSATSISVATGEGSKFPSTYPFHVTVDDEIMECTNRSTDTLTVTRAAESTTAASHSEGAEISLNITSQIVSEIQTAVGTLETSINTRSADYNFAYYKAVALTCDNGATLPSSPVTGTWFLHTPTGRSILCQYNGSSWSPIISFGTMTVYVDSTDGTDSSEKGTAADSSAFKTIQYAVDMIPGLVSGNVTININGETYSETVTVNGKAFTGNYTITLQGTLTAHATNAQDSSVQGATSTYGSITDTGQFTGHANELLYSSNNAEYRIIDSVTADAATIVGYWTAAPSGNYTIYQWSTTLSNFTIGAGQLNVYLKDCYVSGTVISNTASWLTLERCKVGTQITGHGLFDFQYSLLNSATSFSMTATEFGLFKITGSKLLCTNGTPLYSSMFTGVLTITQPSVFDANNVGYVVCYIDLDSAVNFGALYNKIRNTNGAGYGVYGVKSGKGYYTTNNQYSGHASNESVESASYSYID